MWRFACTAGNCRSSLFDIIAPRALRGKSGWARASFLMFAPLLEARGIAKFFGSACVLDGVDFDMRRGEVHALLGENGAGKSTLMNIISGVFPPDSGELLWEGRPISLAGPRDARALGISFVHQELALAPQLSAAENIFLARQPRRRGFVRFGEMYATSRRVLGELGCSVDPRRPVGELSLAERQLVEIARAVAFESRLIIMDEPTTALADHDAQALFETIRRLRARAVSVIYISHRLKEIFEIAGRVTVLRDGKHVFTRPVSDISQDEIVQGMIGKELNVHRTASPACPAVREELLRIEDPVRLVLRSGEIVGLAGLAGAGRTELLESIFGAGEEVRNGLALVPDDRKTKGLVLNASVLDNIVLTGRKHFFIRRARERQAARELAASLRIRAAALESPVVYLSGGNQQKVVLAKWLYAGARVFLLDEPTRGIDVGAKAEIYDMIRTLAARGAAILMASSENEELMGLAHRILVMHRGGIAGELTRAEASEERIMHLATGGVD
jgi:ABC-type sugar transport system ATPase subunit